MKLYRILFLAILIASVSCINLEEDSTKEAEQQSDNRLGQFTGSGGLEYYDLYGSLEASYSNIDVNVKVSNDWAHDDSYRVVVDFPGKGMLNIEVNKKNLSIQDDDYSGSVSISSSKCSGSVSIYNETTNKKSSSYHWSCSK